MSKKRKVDEDSKSKQMKEFTVENNEEFLTTNTGLRVTNTDDSLKAGSRGPTIMEDFHFREKMMHFDHERIPERIVHARGSGAYGYFQVYESMKEYTRAKFLQDPSVKTPVFVRFSTVVGFRGSADTVRDVRGFATKFYTEEGNYDLVGNNMPVFFIQDAIKFPDLVHSIKPEQHNQIPQASAAHDTFWDFVANTPETAHMIMWVLSDRALPRSYSMMDGFGVHTFRFVNEQGKGRFVKFHWRPLQGVYSLVWDETQKIAGKDPDFNRRDLWESIEMGNYPEFEFGVQILEEEDEFKLGVDILDATKLWPEEEVPVKIIGKMTLNRNPDNFFAETEQIAFHPGHVVPGIDFSNDPLLQGRLFSYLDTQISRLGGPNFNEIPINRPVVKVVNNQREGMHRTTVNRGETSYSPNTVASGCPFTAKVSEGGYQHYAEKIEGHKIRERSDSFKDHYSQAALFWNSMTDSEKHKIIKAFHFEIGKVERKEIRQMIVDMFNNVDGELAEKIAKGVGVDPPAEKKPLAVNKKSPSLSQEHRKTTSIKGRKIAVLLAEEFDYKHFNKVKKSLTSDGAILKVISKYQGEIKSSTGETVEVDKNYEAASSVLFDALYLPGGPHSVEKLMKQGNAIHMINEMYSHYKPIAAAGTGIDIIKASAVKGLEYSSGSVLNDKGVVTISDTSGIDEFIKEFKNAISNHRFWERENTEEIPS